MKTFGRKGVTWDAKLESALGLSAICAAIDWLAEQLGIESFAQHLTPVTVKLRAGKDTHNACSLGKYMPIKHSIQVMDRGGTRSHMLSTFVHELVHAFQYGHVAGKSVSVKSQFTALSLRAKYAPTTQGKKYLTKPIEIQAFAYQYKYTQDVLQIAPEGFAGNRVGCYRKIGIDILNIL